MEKDLKDALIAVYDQLENHEKSLAQLRFSLCALREAMREVSPQLDAAYEKHCTGPKCDPVRQANSFALRSLLATKQAIASEPEE
jgi:hypothetical protein